VITNSSAEGHATRKEIKNGASYSPSWLQLAILIVEQTIKIIYYGYSAAILAVDHMINNNALACQLVR
jgi:hypothetical protein